jgi:hypothetical protein
MTMKTTSAGARAKLWAGLTLAMAVATTGAVAIANAESGMQHHVRPDKARSCKSANPCLDETNGSNGPGVEGNSTNGAGVLGYSPNYYGVAGDSQGPNAGVGGFNSWTSSGASGVYGQSANGFGVTGYSSNGYAFYAEGDVLVNGEVYTNGGCQSGCSRTRHELSFNGRTSQPTLDDVGEGTLRNGIAHVSLAPDFANAIDPHKPYLVLLTPEGDASLYVASRTPGSFEVRQMGGGHTSIPFAYRIAAKPYGTGSERLPFKTVPQVSPIDPTHAR